MPGLDPTTLYPELLLTLVGFTGDVFVDDGDPQDVASPNTETFALAREIQLDDIPSRETMNNMARLGFHCRCLQSFVKLQDTRVLHNSTSYRRALARGISEVLDVYKTTVLRLQHYLQVDSRIPLSAMQQFLFEYQIVLPALHHAVYEIHNKEMRGPDMLRLLYGKSHNGVPVLQSCFRRLLWHCNLVLYRHLTAWIAHGMLLDSNGDFFIQRSTEASTPDAPSTEDHEDYSTHSQEWHSGFEVLPGNVPPYISSAVAANVLFIGKAVRILQQPLQQGPVRHWHSAIVGADDHSTAGRTHTARRSLLTEQEALHFAEMLHDLRQQSTFDHLSFETCITDIKAKVAGLQQATDQQQGCFDVVSGTAQCGDAHVGDDDDYDDGGGGGVTVMVVFGCRKDGAIALHQVVEDWKVAERLWQLAVVSADLPRHLTLLRDYFLMAKGDFFQCFLFEGRLLLALPPKLATAESDIMLPFQQAASKVGADHDPLFSNVKITFKLATTVSVTSGALTSAVAATRSLTTTQAKLDGRTLYVPAYDKWDGISMEYDLQWPLHLLLTQEVLAKYGVMFQYLLRLKRLQLALEDAWNTMRHFTAADAAHHRRILKLWSLRHHMTYIMTNLQIYVQVDVIEAQYAKLIHGVESARDFNEAERCHNNFIDALLLQSFLDLRQIMALLEAMMSLCHRMCVMVQQTSGPLGSSSLTDSTSEQKVDSISTDFWRRAKMLYIALQSNKLQASNRAPYLRQFLLRLNFNGYIEREIQKQAAAAGTQ